MSHIISLFEPALLANLVNFDGFIITIITTGTVERYAKFVGNDKRSKMNVQWKISMKIQPLKFVFCDIWQRECHKVSL